MGKSIVHCADCGKAIREDDYVKGHASILDSKNYCSTCRPVTPSASKTLDLRKSSTSRMPLASGLTPRRGTPIASDKSRMPLIAGGAVAAVGLVAVMIFALSGKKVPEPVEQVVEAPKIVKPAVAKVVEVPKPPVEPPATPAIPPAKPAVEEKIPPPLPRPTAEPAPVPIKPESEPAPAAVEPPAPAPAEPAKAEPAPAGKSPEPKKEVAPPVDQKKVDLAIKKGVQYLVSQIGKIPLSFDKEPARTCHSDELVLWTFVHAGVSESTTPFRYLFKSVAEAEFRRTYEVALQAMILEELDRVRYQPRILQCAQFLADNQCKNGQWDYGEPPTKDVPTVYGPLPVPTGSRPAANPAGGRQKPVVVKKLKVRALRNGPAEGDNSNSQYAALGIRACADAGIEFPEDLLTRARKWFRDSQHDVEGGAAGGVATGAGASAPPKGWCYASKWHGHHAYGSMTAGAIGGIAIYDTLLGEDWRKDPAVASGLSWLARNFSVSGNPGPPSETWAKGDTNWCHYYYLYALERTGVLCRTEWMGRHAWYAEGANVLLAAQGRDGAWNGVSDTCFAILFLKRATRPLEDVASMDDRNRK